MHTLIYRCFYSLNGETTLVRFRSYPKRGGPDVVHVGGRGALSDRLQRFASLRSTNRHPARVTTASLAPFPSTARGGRACSVVRVGSRTRKAHHGSVQARDIVDHRGHDKFVRGVEIVMRTSNARARNAFQQNIVISLETASVKTCLTPRSQAKVSKCVENETDIQITFLQAIPNRT